MRRYRRGWQAAQTVQQQLAPFDRPEALSAVTSLLSDRHDCGLATADEIDKCHPLCHTGCKIRRLEQCYEIARDGWRVAVDLPEGSPILKCRKVSIWTPLLVANETSRARRFFAQRSNAPSN